MDYLATLGRTLGFSLAAGVNLYATVAILGLASHYQWVALPEQFKVFDNPWIIGAAGALYVIEFVADKGAVGRLDLGLGAHADSSSRRRLDRGGIAGGGIAGADGTDRASRRRGCRRQSRYEGGHARRCEHQSRAVQQLVPEPGGRRVRDRPELHHAEVSAHRPWVSVAILIVIVSIARSIWKWLTARRGGLQSAQADPRS
jgi:hypothetical protein